MSSAGSIYASPLPESTTPQELYEAFGQIGKVKRVYIAPQQRFVAQIYLDSNEALAAALHTNTFCFIRGRRVELFPDRAEFERFASNEYIRDPISRSSNSDNASPLFPYVLAIRNMTFDQDHPPEEEFYDFLGRNLDYRGSPLSVLAFQCFINRSKNMCFLHTSRYDLAEEAIRNLDGLECARKRMKVEWGKRSKQFLDEVGPSVPLGMDSRRRDDRRSLIGSELQLQPQPQSQRGRDIRRAGPTVGGGGGGSSSMSRSGGSGGSGSTGNRSTSGVRRDSTTTSTSAPPDADMDTYVPDHEEVPSRSQKESPDRRSRNSTPRSMDDGRKSDQKRGRSRSRSHSPRSPRSPSRSLSRSMSRSPSPLPPGPSRSGGGGKSRSRSESREKGRERGGSRDGSPEREEGEMRERFREDMDESPTRQTPSSTAPAAATTSTTTASAVTEGPSIPSPVKEKSPERSSLPSKKRKIEKTSDDRLAVDSRPALPPSSSTHICTKCGEPKRALETAFLYAKCEGATETIEFTRHSTETSALLSTVASVFGLPAVALKSAQSGNFVVLDTCRGSQDVEVVVPPQRR